MLCPPEIRHYRGNIILQEFTIREANSWKVDQIFSTSSKPATVAQHVAHPLVVEKVIGSNLGLTPDVKLSWTTAARPYEVIDRNNLKQVL